MFYEPRPLEGFGITMVNGTRQAPSVLLTDIQSPSQLKPQVIVLTSTESDIIPPQIMWVTLLFLYCVSIFQNSEDLELSIGMFKRPELSY